MYKVGVLMMGIDDPQYKSPTTVKQVILQVQAKTKIQNIFQYLLQLKKIKDMNVSVSLQKGGNKINQTSTISQVLKYTRPINGVIKLYCYQNSMYDPNATSQKIILKPSRHQINDPQVQARKNVINQNPISKKSKQKQKQMKNKNQVVVEEQPTPSKFCCC